MAHWWKNLRLQARFMMLSSLGALGFAVCALAVVGWSELSTLEGNLRRLSENELGSLKSLVETVMERRLDDQQNVAINVFNGWFESRNKDYAGRLWSVWSPKIKTYMAHGRSGEGPENAAGRGRRGGAAHRPAGRTVRRRHLSLQHADRARQELPTAARKSAACAIRRPWARTPAK